MHSSPVHASPATLLALRAALLTRSDLDTVFVLRDAGFAGGDQAYLAFERFVMEDGGLAAESLPLSRFFTMAGIFFSEAGWGEVSFTSQDDKFCVIEIANCWEADPVNQPAPPGCHLTLGFFAAFLGKFANFPISMLEVEGPSTGHSSCRFLAGNTATIAEYYKLHT